MPNMVHGQKSVLVKDSLYRDKDGDEHFDVHTDLQGTFVLTSEATRHH